jgi:hypothetical protein
MRDAILTSAFVAARSHLAAAIDELETSAALVERDGVSDAVVRIGLEVEGHLDCAHAEITRIVGRLEQVGRAGLRIVG